MTMSELPRKVLITVKNAVEVEHIGRSLSPYAVVEKGGISTKGDGSSEFSWKVIKDPDTPAITQENYLLTISPVYTPTGDLTKFDVLSKVEVLQTPRPMDDKVIQGLKMTSGGCSIGFLPGNKMKVECTVQDYIPSGRMADWAEDKKSLIRGINSTVFRARNKAYSNFL